MSRYIFLLLIVMAMGCKSGSRVSSQDSDIVDEFVPLYIPGPRALVYKTKADYSNLVPVILSEDKTQIVSYPHPGDVRVGEKFLTPTRLNRDYFLDNRGIGPDVAFLKLTYEEYAALKSVPELSELYKLIVDIDPLTELCDCGSKSAFSDIEGQLNALIEIGKIRTTCKALL
jgi:hypothetical protein